MLDGIERWSNQWVLETRFNLVDVDEHQELPGGSIRSLESQLIWRKWLRVDGNTKHANTRWSLPAALSDLWNSHLWRLDAIYYWCNAHNSSFSTTFFCGLVQTAGVRILMMYSHFDGSVTLTTSLSTPHCISTLADLSGPFQQRSPRSYTITLKSFSNRANALHQYLKVGITPDSCWCYLCWISGRHDP
jgi:hypothetical protein